MTGDIWIEVAEVPPDAGKFIRAISVPVPLRSPGGIVSASEMKLQLNITAYVKHVVQESKTGD